MKKVNNKGVM